MKKEKLTDFHQLRNTEEDFYRQPGQGVFRWDILTYIQQLIFFQPI